MSNKNLQPWLDYFEMLQTYEQNGYLEMQPEMYEAYITEPALLTLATEDNVTPFRNIRAYAAYKSQAGPEYLQQNFAVHVVKADAPHDLCFTVLFSNNRHWWSLWRKMEMIDIITY